MIPINEIFTSIQGEGPDMGKVTTFVRTFGCNMEPKCSFCDTTYSWDANPDLFDSPQSEKMHINDLVDKLKTMGKDFTFTGGEPLIHQTQLYEIMCRLPQSRFSIETNGLLPIHTIYDRVVVSPKKQNYNVATLSRLVINNQAHLKFVYEQSPWWDDLVKEIGVAPERIWIMPEGATKEKQIAKMPEVIDYCKQTRYNFSPRLHVLAFDNRRGV